MLEIVVDRASPEPLHRQIYDALRRAILDRRLPAGAGLPSTRALAKRLRVSRNTVLNAYETLLLEGLLIAKIGSGTRVSAHPHESRTLPAPKIPHPRTLLRQAHFPVEPAGFEDPDGNLLYVHR